MIAGKTGAACIFLDITCRSDRKVTQKGQKGPQIGYKYYPISVNFFYFKKLKIYTPGMNKNPLIFCDWITVRQTHKKHDPFHGIVTTHHDPETGSENTYLQFKTVEGKHGSSVQIRSDGETVEFSGNPSRFNQPDNIEGIDLDQAKRKINEILASHGLPGFTKGKTVRLVDGERVNTGAKITRVDITTNLKLGSPRKRKIYQRWIQTQNHARLEKLAFGLNTYFGKESESRTFRIYDKAKQIIETKGETPTAVELETAGVLRFEWEYRSFLKAKGFNLWSKCTTQALHAQFKQDIQPMTRKIKTLNYEDLPNMVLGTYLMYERGIDVKARLSKPTYIKHKRILREYGIDITNKLAIVQPPTEIIEPEPYYHRVKEA